MLRVVVGKLSSQRNLDLVLGLGLLSAREQESCRNDSEIRRSRAISGHIPQTAESRRNSCPSCTAPTPRYRLSRELRAFPTWLSGPCSRRRRGSYSVGHRPKPCSRWRQRNWDQTQARRCNTSAPSARSPLSRYRFPSTVDRGGELRLQIKRLLVDSDRQVVLSLGLINLTKLQICCCVFGGKLDGTLKCALRGGDSFSVGNSTRPKIICPFSSLGLRCNVLLGRVQALGAPDFGSTGNSPIATER